MRDYDVVRKDDEVNVILNNEIIYTWYDNASIDYPEDLTWDGMIGDVFYMAFKAGKEFSEGKVNG